MKMRVFLAVVFIGLTTLTAARAQDGSPWANKLFTVDNKVVTSHEFGTVPKGPLLQHRFPLNNIYAVDLQIARAWTSCGCVEVKPPNPVLRSRGSSFIDIVMNTRQIPVAGLKSVTVYVTVVGGNQFTSTAILTVSCNLRTDVVVNPGLAVFGVVPRGQTPTQEVEVRYAGAVAWEITSVVRNDLIDVKAQQLYRQPGGVGYKLLLSPKPEAPAGTYKQELLVATNDPSNPTVPVPFDLTVEDPLTIFPKNLKFPRAIKVGGEDTMPFIVKSGGQPFKITAVDGLTDGLSIVDPLPTDSKPVHNLTIKLAPAQAGSIQKKIQIKSDLNNGATVAAPVEATVGK